MSTLVHGTKRNVSDGSVGPTEQSQVTHVNRIDSRATTKSEVETFCLENIWLERLMGMNWSSRAVERFLYCLAPSTVRSYDKIISKFAIFCDSASITFSPVHSSRIVNFLCEISQSLDRPLSSLQTVWAALRHIYKGFGKENIGDLLEIHSLVKGLVESGTHAPMACSKAMTFKNFHDLLKAWPENEKLNIKDLHLKSITLLALTFI